MENNAAPRHRHGVAKRTVRVAVSSSGRQANEQVDGPIISGDGSTIAFIEDGTISGGMIPKLETCVAAVEAGVDAAVVLGGRVPHAMLLERFFSSQEKYSAASASDWSASTVRILSARSLRTRKAK